MSTELQTEVTRVFDQIADDIKALNSGLGGSADSNKLSVPDLLDEGDPNFFYFGWENVNGGWLVQRQNRSTSITESATAGHANLTDAFADRINLGYA